MRSEDTGWRPSWEDAVCVTKLDTVGVRSVEAASPGNWSQADPLRRGALHSRRKKKTLAIADEGFCLSAHGLTRLAWPRRISTRLSTANPVMLIASGGTLKEDAACC